MASSRHLTRVVFLAVLAFGPLALGCGSTSDGDRVVDPSTGEIVAEWRTFEDTAAGLTFQIPASWPEPETGDLVSFLTSVAAPQEVLDAEEAPDEMVMVGAGQLEATFFNPQADGLNRAAFGLAATTGEFFFPNSGDRTTLVDEAMTTDGVEGWRTRLRVDFHDDGVNPMIIDLVIRGGDRPSYLWTAAQAEVVEDYLPLMDAIVTSARAA